MTLLAAIALSHAQSAAPRLIDPGAEPRIELRLPLAASEQVLELDQQIDIELDGRSEGVGQRTLLLVTMRPEGDALSVDTEVLSMDLRVPMFGADEAEAHIVGLSTHQTLDAHGNVLESALGYRGEPLASLSATLSIVQDMEQLLVPFPTEPVGLGATWGVDDTQRSSRFELVAIDDRTATIEGVAEFEDLPSSATPHVDVDVDRGSARSKVSFPLTNPFLATVETTMEVTGTLKGDAVTVTSRLTAAPVVHDLDSVIAWEDGWPAALQCPDGAEPRMVKHVTPLKAYERAGFRCITAEGVTTGPFIVLGRDGGWFVQGTYDDDALVGTTRIREDRGRGLAWLEHGVPDADHVRVTGVSWGGFPAVDGVPTAEVRIGHLTREMTVAHDDALHALEDGPQLRFAVPMTDDNVSRLSGSVPPDEPLLREIGILREEGTMRDDERVGTWRRYDEYGQLERAWTPGQQEQSASVQDEEHTRCGRVDFGSGQQGECPAGSFELSPDGWTRSLCVSEIDGQPEGETVFVDPDNPLLVRARGRFEEGRMQGPWTFYYPVSGQVAAEGAFDALGRRHGSWTYRADAPGNPELTTVVFDKGRVAEPFAVALPHGGRLDVEPSSETEPIDDFCDTAGRLPDPFGHERRDYDQAFVQAWGGIGHFGGYNRLDPLLHPSEYRGTLEATYSFADGHTTERIVWVDGERVLLEEFGPEDQVVRRVEPDLEQRWSEHGVETVRRLVHSPQEHYSLRDHKGNLRISTIFGDYDNFAGPLDVFDAQGQRIGHFGFRDRLPHGTFELPGPPDLPSFTGAVVFSQLAEQEPILCPEDAEARIDPDPREINIRCRGTDFGATWEQVGAEVVLMKWASPGVAPYVRPQPEEEEPIDEPSSPSGEDETYANGAPRIVREVRGEGLELYRSFYPNGMLRERGVRLASDSGHPALAERLHPVGLWHGYRPDGSLWWEAYHSRTGPPSTAVFWRLYDEDGQLLGWFSPNAECAEVFVDTRQGPTLKWPRDEDGPLAVLRGDGSTRFEANLAGDTPDGTWRWLASDGTQLRQLQLTWKTRGVTMVPAYDDAGTLRYEAQWHPDWGTEGIQRLYGADGGLLGVWNVDYGSYEEAFTARPHDEVVVPHWQTSLSTPLPLLLAIQFAELAPLVAPGPTAWVE